MLINLGTVTLQEAILPVLLIGRRIVAISIPHTHREYNTILLDCVSHYSSTTTTSSSSSRLVVVTGSSSNSTTTSTSI